MSDIRTFAAALGAGLTTERALALSELPSGPVSEVVHDVLRISRETGIPRVAALMALADSLDESERRTHRVELGSASARQTQRILLGLPVATALGAEFFGFRVVPILVTTPLGWVCMLTGVGLSVLAWRWMVRIRSAIPNPPIHVGLVTDLAAGIARSSALSTASRQTLAERATAWGTFTEIDGVERHRQLSHETGVPAAALLELEARRVREAVQRGVTEAIELLPGRLLMPIGLCLLPAFVASTVVPIVASMATNFVS